MRRLFEWLFYVCLVAPLGLAAIAQAVALVQAMLASGG